MLENKYSVNSTSRAAAALLAGLRVEADAYEGRIVAEQRTAAELCNRWVTGQRWGSDAAEVHATYLGRPVARPMPVMLQLRDSIF